MTRTTLHVHSLSRAAGRNPRARRFETLERRQLLTAIVWENRGTVDQDTDGFNAAFQADAELARSLVDQVIADWQDVVPQMGQSAEFPLRVRAGDLVTADPFPECGSPDDDLSHVLAYACHLNDDVANQTPIAANLAIDDDAASGGWHYAFTDGPGSDFYSVIAHELGHALGITTDPRLNLSSYLGPPTGVDPHNADAVLREFSHEGVTATFTTSGGGHLFEDDHAQDLLNSGRAATLSSRTFVSDLDARILAAAYGYEVQLPSSRGGQAQLAEGVLTVLGTEADDSVAIAMAAGEVQVTLDDVLLASYDGSLIDEIQVFLKGGNDVLVVDASVAKPSGLDGGAGDDQLTGGSVTNTLIGGAGDDTLVGGEGSDRLMGGTGTNILSGEAGNDTYLLGAEGGWDIVLEAAEQGSADHLDYSALGSKYSVTVNLDTGLADDSLPTYLVTGSQQAQGETVFGHVLFLAGSLGYVERITGSQGADSLTGNGQDNLIHGAGGNDTILGLGGNDTIYGDGGADQLHGGDGDDRLYGGSGQDVLYGESGDDLLNGGQDGSRDTLYGGEGADTFVRPLTLTQSYYYTFQRVGYWNPVTYRYTYYYIPRKVYYYTYTAEDSTADFSTADGDVTVS